MLPDFESKLLKKAGSLIPEGKLREAVLYALKSGGKRLRPRFMWESALSIGLTEGEIEAPAMAIEMVHLFSLIHDDLPCMDNDDLRRGVPTVHRAFDESQALLAGDELLSLATSVFLETKAEPYRLMKALGFFHHCVQEMIRGQSMELEIQNPTEKELLQIQDLKTSALFRASILTPLYLWESALNEHHQNYLAYANAFGFAFQVADDIEDAGQDSKQQQKNILSFHSVESARKMALDRLLAQPVHSTFSATELLVQKLRQ